VNVPSHDERPKRPLRGLCGGGGCLLAVFLVILPALPLLGLLPNANCWHESVDLTCGRTRYERYLYGVRWIDRVEETTVSQVYRAQVGTPGPPTWRRSLTLSPGVGISPHYLHHSGLHDLRRLSQLLRGTGLNAAAETKAVQTYLMILQADDSDERGGRFVKHLEDLVQGRGAFPPLTAAEIPGPDFP
jgi:hypothetical protein